MKIRLTLIRDDGSYAKDEMFTFDDQSKIEASFDAHSSDLQDESMMDSRA